MRTMLSAYPLTPMEARHAYGFDQLQLSSNDGTGQTIAIVDAYDDPNIFSDLDTFDKQYGVVTGQTLYQQYGASSSFLTKAKLGRKTRADSGWAQEISLDVEWAHAIAPGAKIMLVEARSNSISDLLSAVDYATNNGAQVVSMSWGAGEFSSETSYDSHFNHAGITYVASAGDTGSVTEWPAVSPYVLAVGGTSLNVVDPSGAYISETGWGNIYGGSGGGISAYVSKPSYQANVSLGGTKRTSPDVGYDADPNTGFAVYDSYAGGGGLGQYGGTSAGAPQWAALVAIADQGRTTKLGSTDTLNAIYGLLNSSNAVNSTYLHDVTSGSSGTYSAAPGYDLVTGVGTPKADQLITYLRGPGTGAAAVASATPTTSTTSTAKGHPVHPRVEQVLPPSRIEVVNALTVPVIIPATQPAIAPSINRPTFAPLVVASGPAAPLSSTGVSRLARLDGGGENNPTIVGEHGDDGRGDEPTPLPAEAPGMTSPAVLPEFSPISPASPDTGLPSFGQPEPQGQAVGQFSASLVESTGPEGQLDLQPCVVMAGFAMLLGGCGRIPAQEPDADKRRLRRELPQGGHI